MIQSFRNQKQIIVNDTLYLYDMNDAGIFIINTKLSCCPHHFFYGDVGKHKDEIKPIDIEKIVLDHEI